MQLLAGSPKERSENAVGWCFPGGGTGVAGDGIHLRCLLIERGYCACGPGDSVLAQVNAYVANASNNTVSVIDTASNTIIATVPVGRGPVSLAVTVPVRHEQQ